MHKTSMVDIDCDKLIDRVLDFFGILMLDMRVMNQFVLIDDTARDLVIPYDAFGNGISLYVAAEDTKASTSARQMASHCLLQMLKEAKTLEYMHSRKTVENPFFRWQCLEEVALKLDLLEEKRDGKGADLED